MLRQIPIFIVVRGNNDDIIKINKESLKYVYVYIKDMNMFNQTWIISDNENIIEYSLKLGFKNAYYQKCNNENDITYLEYISLYNFYKEKQFKPDWFILLSLNQPFRDYRLLSDCIKNIDNKYDVIASYTEQVDKDEYCIENNKIILQSRHITYEKKYKKIVDASIYAIKADFAIKCMTSDEDPAVIFWSGKIKYFKNYSLLTNIYNINDINNLAKIREILDKVNDLKI